jgi:hypothetical protein
MKREILTIGSETAIILRPEELAALGVTPGGQVEVAIVGTTLEVNRVSPYADMSMEELMPIIERLMKP